jgi:hypothetical protein
MFSIALSANLEFIEVHSWIASAREVNQSRNREKLLEDLPGSAILPNGVVPGKAPISRLAVRGFRRSLAFVMTGTVGGGGANGKFEGTSILTSVAKLGCAAYAMIRLESERAD